MKKSFITTTNHKFEIDVVNSTLTAEQAQALIDSIETNLAMEVPENKQTLLATVVSSVNASFKAIACHNTMLSTDVLGKLALGVHYGKLYVARENDVVTINYDVAQRVEKVKKVDNNWVYATRFDYVKYTDVMRAYRAYNAELKKSGFKDGYALQGGLSPEQNMLAIVAVHNFVGKLSEKDIARIEKMGSLFNSFTKTSKTGRLEILEYFYALFNEKTVQTLKPIGFIVDKMAQDKLLATFDSMHYTDTVPSEQAFIDVVLMHYINTGLATSVIEKNRGKKLSDVAQEEKKEQKKAK